MNPEGSLLPGVTTFAITPATNPIMMVQIMRTALSHSSQSKYHYGHRNLRQCVFSDWNHPAPSVVKFDLVAIWRVPLDALGARRVRFRREPPLRRILIDCIREFAAQSREQLFARQAGLFRQGVQHLRANRLLKLGRRARFVGARFDPGLRGFSLAALLEAVEKIGRLPNFRAYWAANPQPLCPDVF
jgi:hypothetical protein